MALNGLLDEQHRDNRQRTGNVYALRMRDTNN